MTNADDCGTSHTKLHGLLALNDCRINHTMLHGLLALTIAESTTRSYTGC